MRNKRKRNGLVFCTVVALHFISKQWCQNKITLFTSKINYILRDIGSSLPELLWKLVEVIPQGCRLRYKSKNITWIFFLWVVFFNSYIIYICIIIYVCSWSSYHVDEKNHLFSLKEKMDEEIWTTKGRGRGLPDLSGWVKTEWSQPAIEWAISVFCQTCHVKRPIWKTYSCNILAS